MRVAITTPVELGQVVRAVRKTQRLRVDDAAAFAGVGPVFAMDVEHGKTTVQLGLVLRLLAELGLKLEVDLPDAAAPMLDQLKAKGLRPRKPRAAKRAEPQ